MLKKCILKKGMIITLTLLFSLIIIGNLAQAQTQRGNYRIGFQSSTLFQGTAGLIGGAGIGVEYDIQALDHTLPPVSVNADVGLIVLDDLSSFNNKIRISFHYRF